MPSKQASTGLLIFGLLFVTWIEAMAAADWIRYLEKKLLLATGCVIALTVGAQAKPIQLGLIDNKWVIEYDSELFAGACIATLKYNLLTVKISFITAYPREGEGTEKLWFVGLSSPEWTWIKSSATYDFAIDTQRKGGETKNWPLVFTGGSNGFMFAKVNVDIVNSWLVTMEIFCSTFVILKLTNISLKGIVGILVSQRQQFVQL